MTGSRVERDSEIFQDKAWWQKLLLFVFIGFVFMWSLVTEHDWIIIGAIVAAVAVWTWPAWKPLLFLLAGFYALVIAVVIAMGLIGGAIVYSGWQVGHRDLIESD